VSERQLRNTFAQAIRQTGNTGVRLLQLLELRLDAVVVRAGFVRTIYAARQAVAHGHFMVNGKKVDRPSYRVQPGDVVTLAARSKDMIAFTVPLENARPPAYLHLDKDKRSVRVNEVPERDQIPVQCEASLIVEFYSR
jgi:small subunit ribosomal protein S4